MYDKVSLQSCRNQQKLFEQDNDDNDSDFSQMILYGGRRFCKHRKEALSSNYRIRHGRKTPYHTYPFAASRLCMPAWGKASLTLEMTVVLPLFVSFLVYFLFLFRVLWVQESVEEALLYASRSLAIASFDAEKQETSGASIAKAELLFLQGLKESACPVSFVQGEALGISLLGSNCDGDEIVLRASYEMRVPCTLTGRFSYRLTQCARSRKWIGDRSLEEETAAAEQWVYITPEGEAYHTTRTCHYLDLTIRAVHASACPTLRNASGAVYKRCEACGRTDTATVYITDYGARYHSSLSCKGLKRTIYMVKKTQTGGRHLCSKCGVSSQS